MKRAFAWILAAALLMMGGAAMAEGMELRATGMGIVRVQPDIVTISANAQALDENVGEAQRQIGQIVLSATEKLIELGVAENDIVTGSYGFYPSYNYNEDPPTLTGYNAYHSLEIVCRDIEMLDAAVGVLTDCGFTRLDSIDFGVSDSSAAYRQALAMAIEDATGKAQTMADAAGAKALRVERIEENAVYDFGMARAYANAKGVTEDDAATGIRYGGISVSAGVSMVFEAE